MTTPIALVATLTGSQALADTTDVTWKEVVTIEKTGNQCIDDPKCFNRYHPAIPMIETVQPGDDIVFHTRDALDSDLTLDSNADDLAAVDLNFVHPLTGPVSIEGAERGDVLAVTLLDIEPDQFGYTVIVPGFGFTGVPAGTDSQHTPVRSHCKAPVVAESGPRLCSSPVRPRTEKQLNSARSRYPDRPRRSDCCPPC